MAEAIVGKTWLDQVAWNADRLVPAIAQDATSGTVLMMAWMNREALEATMRDGHAIYWSRSRGKLWRKGESSGHTQEVVDIRLDCDGDTILLKVHQRGGVACHTGRESCFYLGLQAGEEPRWHSVEPVKKSPDEIYQ
ncbi:phosphoribosyl-AMP cyclohydrolase [Sansalvadorimonas verongulae]|uniref:phosphoribosyl-AMP cyclohydrolase n=1 Tax=Sansalvadorimonas verongulae TaxID=2172824 RepID=UPI0012BC5979|nr:phosphoribosyl-AMP cyclohydrolase [Sansalvadorimonas verongulae]MTI15492.1 phosphoribosyl-AMP cyclohydrolase [Sansalvadorimonas verongulae]